MKRELPCILIMMVGITLLGADDVNGDIKAESKKLQGTWSVTRARRDGIIDTELANAVLIVAENQFTSKSRERIMVRGTWKLDPTKNPKTIDIEYTAGPDKGQTVRGIYALHDGTWILVLSPAGEERPRSFRAELKVGYTSFVLKTRR